MTKKLLILLVLLFFNYESKSQDTLSSNSAFSISPYFGNSLDKSKLTAANVSAIEKTASIPTNLNTGQIQFSLPLLEVSVDNKLQVPIILSYSNSGFKPEEIPSWVGHGWSLESIATITQYIKGTDDLDGGLTVPWVRDELESYFANTMTSTHKHQYNYDVFHQLKDSQFDVFSINIFGRTNKFYFDRDSIRLMKHELLDIKRVGPNFEIIDELGYKYLFQNKVKSSIDFTEDPLGSQVFKASAVTWYLTKIITPQNTETSFEYISDTGYKISESDYALRNGSYVDGDDCRYDHTYYLSNSQTQRDHQQLLLARITTPYGYAVFTAGNRFDLLNVAAVPNKKLESIQIFNIENTLIKKIEFLYSYYHTPSSDRLKLQSVSISGTAPTFPYIYGFEYYSLNESLPIPNLTGKPSPQMHALDYWDYYNGKTTNYNKVPAFMYSQQNPRDVSGLIRGGANRHPDENASIHTMLKKIVYPNKGYDEFFYEANAVIIPFNSSVSFYHEGDQIPYYSPVYSSGNLKSGSFNLSNPVIDAKFKVYLEKNTNLTVTHVATNTTILNLSTTSEIDNSYILNLSAGQYSFSITGPSGTFTLENVSTNYYNLKVGGNRISKIKRYPQVGKPEISYFEYIQSSLSYPIEYYYHKSVAKIRPFSNDCELCGNEVFLTFKNINSFDGFHIEYSLVKEQNLLKGEVETQYETWPSLGNWPSFVDLRNRPSISWRHSLTKKQWVRRDAESQTINVALTENGYSAPPTFPFKDRSLIVKLNYGCQADVFNPISSHYIYGNSSEIFYTDYFGKIQDIKTHYNDNGFINQRDTVNYFYNADWQVYRVSQNRPVNRKKEQITYFANDFSTPEAINLQNRHILAQPLKIIQLEDQKVTRAETIKTDINGRPTEIYEYQSLLAQTHNPSVFLGSEDILRETRKYNSRGNLTFFVNRDGVPYTYLWSYGFSHPVALIANASLTQIEALIGSIETFGTLTSDSAISSAINIVRSGLTHAHITSALYKVGIGIKELTDASGKKLTYEFDSQNRLIKVKDHNGNIMDTYSYQNALTLNAD